MKNELIKNLNLDLLSKTIIFFRNIEEKFIDSYSLSKFLININIKEHSFVIDKYCIGYKNNEIKNYIIINENFIEEIVNDKIKFNCKEIEKLSYIYHERSNLKTEILEDLFYISIVETDTESDYAKYFSPTYEINVEEIKKVMKFLKYINNQDLKIRLFESYGLINGGIHLESFFNNKESEITFKGDEISINGAESVEIDGVKTLEIKFAKFNYEDYQSFNKIDLNSFIEKNKLINTIKKVLKN